jgi:serine/threonine protein kinase
MSFLPDGVLSHLQDVAERPDLTGTRYELLGEVGRGGMGVVYLVRDRVLDRQAALKLLDGEFVEGRIMAGMEHPGVVPVYDAGRLPDGRSFYVMRHVEGTRLDESRTLGLVDKLRIFERIVDAVGYAHSRGVIHRDLKPQNIMVGRFGEVFVMDWGVARVGGAAEPEGMVIGTPRYMAPEQATGRSHEATPAADIFSLGAILDGLIGPAAPRALRAIVAKATAGLPDDRYREAEDLNREIGRYLEGEAVEAHRETWPETLARFARRNRVLLILMAVYLAVKFGLYFLRRP